MSATDSTNSLESVSEFQEDRLCISFVQHPHDERMVMVHLAGRWTGINLLRQMRDGEVGWWVMDRPHLGWFRARGEAVFAAILTTFDPDNDRELTA